MADIRSASKSSSSMPKELGPEMKSTGEAIAFVDALTDAHFQRPYEMRNLYFLR